MTLFYGLFSAKFLGVKFINGSIRAATPVKYYPFFVRLVTKIGTKFSNINIANSVSGLQSQGLKPSERNFAILNGFDFRRIQNISPKEEILNEFGITTKFIVGMVALFADRKDYGTFLKAAVKVLKAGIDVTFLCVGGGPRLEYYKESVDPDFKDYIKFLGDRHDVESIVNTFDIGVLTSNTTRGGEGISNSIMEYMALAKPAIASDSGGNKELIINGETGFIIDPFDDTKLAELIILLLNDPAQKEILGNKAKERITNVFSMDKMVSDYSTLYSGIINN